MDLNKLKQAKQEMATKLVGTDTVLVPLKGNVADLDVMFTLNEVGTFVWNELGNATSEEGIVSSLLEEFDVDQSTAKDDVRSFLEELEEFVAKA